MISEQNFVDRVLNIWYDRRAEERELIIEKIKSFDENNDGVFQFDEFENLLKQMEPTISRKLILELFKTMSEKMAAGQGSFECMANLILDYRIGGYG